MAERPEADPLLTLTRGEENPTSRNLVDRTNLLASLASEAVRQAAFHHDADPSSLRVETQYHTIDDESQEGYGKVQVYDERTQLNAGEVEQ